VRNRTVPALQLGYYVFADSNQGDLFLLVSVHGHLQSEDRRLADL
jgi:hypothetical protein